MQTVRELGLRLAGDVIEGRLAPGARLTAVRVLAGELGCAPATVAGAYAQLRSAGVITGPQRARARVAADGAARARAMLVGRLRLAGSDDLALDVLLRVAGTQVEVVPGSRGSVTGLGQLSRGVADVCAMHLFHAATGRFNDPFVGGLLGGEAVALVHLWRRDQGLVVPRGNPLRIRGVADLGRCRVAWRAPGTGSRLLLERLLDDHGLVVDRSAGLVAESHIGVAAAVACGAADAGLAVRAAAEAVDAEWIPVAVEPFELAIPVGAMPAAGPLLDLLAGVRVQAQLAALPGYDLSESGRVRRVA
jgi:molybdate-binding protein